MFKTPSFKSKTSSALCAMVVFVAMHASGQRIGAQLVEPRMETTTASVPGPNLNVMNLPKGDSTLWDGVERGFVQTGDLFKATIFALGEDLRTFATFSAAKLRSAVRGR